MEAAIAGDQTGAAAPVEAAVQQPAAEAAQDMVPVAALQAERRERQQLQENVKMLQDHMALLEARGRQPEQEKGDDLGLQDDDVLTVGQFKKVLQAQQQQYHMGIEELRVSQKYKDYEDVVQKYLPEVIRQNPALRNTLQSDPNRYELAYYLAKNSDAFRNASKEAVKSEAAERMVRNANQTGNLSAVGGTAPKSQVNSWKSMSDKDFMSHVHKHMGAF